MIIDTHCHVQDPKYDPDRDGVIERARAAGVAMICVGTDLKMSQDAIALAKKHSSIWASVGLHPNDNLDESYEAGVYEQLAKEDRVVAIGEVGLDYYHTTDDAKKQFQRERFEQQLDLAIRLEKPLIIHCRDGSTSLTTGAHHDMIEILKGRDRELPGGVIHSFTGTVADATQYLELGFCIGLNGIITFTEDYNEVVRMVPLDRILLETDAPYLAPIPYRGQRNEPAYITEVVKRIGELKDIPDADVIAVTTETAQTLFQLDF